MTELKPCPFCGYEGLTLHWEMPPVLITCQKCRIEFSIYGATVQETIEAWNKRHEQPTED